jgi:hypothetical protein
MRAASGIQRYGSAQMTAPYSLMARSTGGEVPWLQPYPDRLLDELPAGNKARRCASAGSTVPMTPSRDLIAA